MSTSQIILMLRSALGPITRVWQMTTGYDKNNEAFTVIRYGSPLKKGTVRRMHALIEDILSEELGQGDRE